MPTYDQKSLKKLIDRRHPDYKDSVAHWEFLESCYRGGRDWFDKHIFKYIKEGDDEFGQRVERAYRFNHSREIVDLVNKYIFKAQVVRNTDDAPEQVRQFWKNATRNKRDIEHFMRQLSNRSSTFGRIWVVVDNNKPGDAKTVAEEKELGARTYAYFVSPLHVLDMSYDEEGELNWILIHEVDRDDEDPLESTGGAIERYRLWTREDWTLFKMDGKKVELEGSGTHNLGIVPVFNVDHVETDDPYTAPSLIGDIAYLDRAVANYLSNLDAIIQDQTFSQLAMPAQGMLPGDDGYTKLVEMGTKRIFTYDGEGGSKPFFIAPDPKQAELIIGAIRQIINEIYHSVGMAGERTKQDNAMGIDNSSGVAKAYDFERVNALLTSKADSLDRAESKLIELVCLWNNVEAPEEDLVKYADNFDVRSLTDEFDVAERLALIDAPDSVRREQMQALVEKLFPRLSEALKKKRKEEIQNWPEKPVEIPTPSSLFDGEEEEESDPTADGQADQEAA